MIEVLLVAGALLAAFGIELYSNPEHEYALADPFVYRSANGTPSPAEQSRHARLPELPSPDAKFLVPNPFAPVGEQLERAIRDAAIGTRHRTKTPC